MLIRQSEIKRFMDCPLQFRFMREGHPREQSSALTWGTLIHEAVLRLERWDDLPRALDWFTEAWMDPTSLDASLKIDYMMPRTSFKKYLDEGIEIIERWAGIYRWDTEPVLARECEFTVPVVGTEHELTGTIDRLTIRYVGDLDAHVVLIQDYKTNRKVPTYNYLQHDLQFTAYAYATTRPEFWATFEDGDDLYERYRDLPRHGEWIHLRGPKRMNAGERTELHYARLRYAVNAIADSIAMGIYVPNISGESCTYCDFRKACGLPTLDEEGYLEKVKASY